MAWQVAARSSAVWNAPVAVPPSSRSAAIAAELMLTNTPGDSYPDAALQADGTLTQVIDSPAVAITASAALTGSINAAGALVVKPTGADGDVARIASEAGILTGFGSGRPTVKTDGNFTAVSGDVFRVDAFRSGPPQSGSAGSHPRQPDTSTARTGLP